MLRRSGLVKDCFIVCNDRRNGRAASLLDVEVDVSEVPDVSPVKQELQTLERSSDVEARHVGGLYRRWLRLWSVNCLV